MRWERIGEKPTKTSRGFQVAQALAGAWRAAPPPLEMTPEQLAEIASLLIEGGAGSLAWRRLGLARLRNSTAGRALRDAFLYQTLEVAGAERTVADAFRRLRSAGVEPILIKGWVVAQLYPDQALRPYSDFDLCVDPGQLPAAKRVLTEAHGKLICVELHEGVPDLPERSWTELLRRTQLIPLGETSVRALGFEDQLRQLCIHFLRHGALRPLWLCDIAAAIERLPADFDWDYFLSGDPCAAPWVLCFLGLARHLLGAATASPPILRAAENLPDWMIDNVLWRWGNGMQRVSPYGLLRRPGDIPGVVRHHWFNRMSVAYRSRLSPDCSLPRILVHATLQQPIKAAIRLKRIVTTRFRKWTRTPEFPFNLHLREPSRYL